MDRQPYIWAWASSFRGYEVFVHFAAVRDRLTGRAFRLDPDVTARAIWQSVRRLG
jgi:hypothetical protein